MDRDHLQELAGKGLGASRSGRPLRSAVFAALLAAAWVTACARAGSTAPGPVAAPAPPGAAAVEQEPVLRIDTALGERIGWGGLWVGSSPKELEESLGWELPDLEEVEPDLLCDRRTVEVSHLGRHLALEFEGAGEGARLAAITLRLDPGERSRTEVVRALKARFAGLEYLPSPYAPGVSEEENPRPVYQVPGDGRIFLNLPEGVYFGEICVD
jgi:hypothetical protein